MRSIAPVDHLQIICNGNVVRDLKLAANRESADVSDTISISRSGWCLLRAYSEKPEHPILDLYPYATTSPIYVNAAGSAPNASDDAAYFLAWIGRLESAVQFNQDWNTAAEKAAVLKTLQDAKDVYKKLQ